MARRLRGAPAVFMVLASILALLFALTVPAFAGDKDDTKKDSKNEEVSDERNKTSDHDGDADSDPNTAYEDDHDTADEGDNAHPSGKDRSVENGGSGNQGNSESEPDDDGHGPERDYQGTDKPGGPGGVDKDDQDGNNGCGNDDDFEDDNEGWCGKPPKDDEVQSSNEKKDDKVCDADHNMKGVQPCEKDDDDVKAGTIENPAEPCDADATMAGIQECGEEEVGNDVLGVTLTAPNDGRVAPAVAPATVRGARERGGVLPFTGGDIVGFVFLALGLVAAGYLMLRSRRVTR